MARSREEDLKARALSAKKYRKNNARIIAIRDIMDKYTNGDIELAEKLYERQRSETCEVCGKHDFDNKGKRRPLAIDHREEPHKVRGLLCKKHNTGYGQYDEKLERIKNGKEYLLKHKKTRGDNDKTDESTRSCTL